MECVMHFANRLVSLEPGIRHELVRYGMTYALLVPQSRLSDIHPDIKIYLAFLFARVVFGELLELGGVCFDPRFVEFYFSLPSISSPDEYAAANSNGRNWS